MLPDCAPASSSVAANSFLLGARQVLLICCCSLSLAVAASNPALASPVDSTAASTAHFDAVNLWHGAGPQQASIGTPGGLELFCIFGERERRQLRANSQAGQRNTEDVDADQDRPWIVRLCRSWFLLAFFLLVVSGELRAAEPLAPRAVFARSQDPPAMPVSRRTIQEGSPNSGDAYAPRVSRPYWESPNIIIEEADEYPRPASLECNDASSFFYTMRPNILNIPVSDEWDFYNLINTDRPDFTDALYSVGKGVTFLESGYTFHKINDAQTHLSTRQLPETLLRHGLTDEFELRIKWNGYLMTDYKDLARDVHLTEFGGEDLDLGFKWELVQQRGWRPMFTVVSGLIVPTGTRGVSANGVEPHVNLVYGWGLRRWLYLKGQTGVDFLKVSNSPVSVISSVVPGFVIERSAQNSWHQSFCFLTQWSKRVGAFHEWFMIQNTGSGDTRALHYFDMGTYIYLTPNIQIDARIGKRASDRVNDTFTGVGFSARW